MPAKPEVSKEAPAAHKRHLESLQTQKKLLQAKLDRVPQMAKENQETIRQLTQNKIDHVNKLIKKYS